MWSYNKKLDLMKHILLSVAIVISLLTWCSSSDSTRAISELSENEARELAISALAEDDIQNGSGEFTLEQHLEIAECSIDYMKNNSDYTYVELAQYWTFLGTSQLILTWVNNSGQ